MNHTYSTYVSRSFLSRSFVSKSVVTTLVVALLFGAINLVSPSNAQAQSAAFQISGDGVIGEDSVQVGKDFSLDLYLTNSGKLLGFTLGFQISGKDGLKSITHLWSEDLKDSDAKSQSSKYLESNITALNGFESTTYWDMGQLMKPVYSWDGKLPDSMLLGGVAMNKGWPKTEKPTHYVSIGLRANQAGSVCIDSAFIPPSGAWLFAPETRPQWAGEYCVTAVAVNPCAGKGEAKGKE